jgi:hypothetical protein
MYHGVTMYYHLMPVFVPFVKIGIGEVGIYTRERVYYSMEYKWNFNQWRFYFPLMGDKVAECGTKKLKIGII